MTMPQYTEESLDKLLKIELIPIVLPLEKQNRSLQSRMSEVNNEVVEEMRKFNENFSKLQSELSIAKRVNTELTKRIVTLERQCWANAQYSRKECVEVVGIPRQVNDKHLEVKGCQSSKRLLLNSLMTVIDLIKITTESMLNSLVRRTANKYFKSRKT